jgi:NAD(P)H-dependent flavin oxidoreductase YrpB (nitropropane dioxygenase family)
MKPSARAGSFQPFAYGLLHSREEPMTDAGLQPLIIQGGMGAAVSNWRLARAVSLAGQLGVVSGTGIDSAFVRRLQDGDPGGHMRRAIERFPIPGVAAEALRRYFRAHGRSGDGYRLLPLPRQVESASHQRLTMLAAFAEVTLAKEGHTAPVGINLLAKIQIPTLPTLYGAMLAGVDVVLMGAGIPRDIPGALDALARGEPAAIRFDVAGLSPGREEELTFDPREHIEPPPVLKRPAFFAIVASNSLATMLARKANGRVDGFVIEGPTAGGHNAPPRGTATYNDAGEPVYGERDRVDLAALKELGLPFWVAGGTGHPDRLAAVRAAGAAGVQVGTLFAFCEESGFDQGLRTSVLGAAARGEVTVRTDPHASPTGYPFKVVSWSEDPARGATRERLCDMGYLRTPYQRPDGKIGYRCAGEPVEDYVAKGGAFEDTVGRRCLCNALMAAIGHGQVRDDGAIEAPVVTSGDDLLTIGAFLRGRTDYSAADVIEYLLNG